MKFLWLVLTSIGKNIHFSEVSIQLTQEKTSISGLLYYSNSHGIFTYFSGYFSHIWFL